MYVETGRVGDLREGLHLDRAALGQVLVADQQSLTGGRGQEVDQLADPATVGLLVEPGPDNPAERAQQLLDVLLATDERQPDAGGGQGVSRLPETVLECGGSGLAGPHMDEDRTTLAHGARVSKRTAQLILAVALMK